MLPDNRRSNASLRVQACLFHYVSALQRLREAQEEIVNVCVWNPLQTILLVAIKQPRREKAGSASPRQINKSRVVSFVLRREETINTIKQLGLIFPSKKTQRYGPAEGVTHIRQAVYI